MGGLRDLLSDQGVPFLLAVLSVLGGLGLLDAVGPVYFPMVHRAIRAVRSEVCVGIVGPLLVLLSVWVGWVASGFFVASWIYSLWCLCRSGASRDWRCCIECFSFRWVWLVLWVVLPS
jgi:hypothetical protein